MPDSHVIDRLKEQGIDLLEELFPAIDELQSMSKVAKRFDTTPENIRYHLGRRGIAKRWVQITDDEILDKMQELGDEHLVATFFNISPYYVKDVINGTKDE